MHAPASRRRRALVAVFVAATSAATVAGPAAVAAQEAPPSGAREALAATVPVETPGVDPVLDGVSVTETAATRAGDAEVSRRAARQVEAEQSWVAAEQNRAGLLARAATAAERVVEAELTLVARRDEQQAAQEELDRRQLIETDLRSKLAVEQELLRTLVAAVYTSAPDDAYEVLGSLQDFTAADRRDVARRRGLGVQSDRVDAARAPWEEAAEAADAQAGATDAAAAATERAAAALVAATDERDRSDTLVAAATADAQAADAARAEAAAATEAALADRREARLEATVAATDMPLVALHAYWRAAQLAPCTLPWWLLAGVGRTESGHGSSFGSELDAAGNTTVPIVGIALDGSPGVAAIGDTDGGRFDQDPVWDRAVGPMQFIPGTWGRWATDGNADDEADPHNIYDASAAAAAYLCFGRGELTSEAAWRAALLAYNRSVPYGDKVLAEAERYRQALELVDYPEVDVAQPSD